MLPQQRPRLVAAAQETDGAQSVAAAAAAAAIDRQTLERQQPTGVTTLRQTAPVGSLPVCFLVRMCRVMAHYFRFCVGAGEIASRFARRSIDARLSDRSYAPRINRRLLAVTTSSTAH